jgi:hypothetical protein
MNTTRNGTVLIIVAGITALLAALALTFLVRMRSDVYASQATVLKTQAHIMMVAGCNFIMERSRLGWDPPIILPALRPAFHREAFGWIDVRDGQPGPKDESNTRIGLLDQATGTVTWDDWVNLELSDSLRPAQICEMYVQMQPPYAVSPKVAPNPIIPTGLFAFKPFALYPDPAPFKSSYDPNDIKDLSDYVKGDPRMDIARKVPSWFRVWRATANTFVITAGAGESGGYKDWDEVPATVKSTRFGGDKALFSLYLEQEFRLYYLVEWSPYVASSDYQNLQNEYHVATPTDLALDTYLQRSINVSQESRSQGRMVNHVGTIRSIQRLTNVPKYY